MSHQEYILGMGFYSVAHNFPTHSSTKDTAAGKRYPKMSTHRSDRGCGRCTACPVSDMLPMDHLTRRQHAHTYVIQHPHTLHVCTRHTHPQTAHTHLQTAHPHVTRMHTHTHPQTQCLIHTYVSTQHVCTLHAGARLAPVRLEGGGGVQRRVGARRTQPRRSAARVVEHQHSQPAHKRG